MSSNPDQARKPYDATTYASLRSADAARAEQKAGISDAPASVTNEFLSEAERLRALREALWVAFDAGPAAGLPNVLIDLTMAYTSSLRLQLSLKALTHRQAGAKPKRILNPEAANKTSAV
ncbi:MAG: hypothetical protein EKK41_20185 [Hyphomicrobiales bacterium]|nr:MAG: hypothetical protein EKK41_20185 [Hyphomicrobiales bacterium]